MVEAVQTTLHDSLPLRDVMFCVVDLETTGGSPAASGITEIGAVKYCGGELVGTFHSLVDPEVPIPPFITHLTGIDDRVVRGAPAIGGVLPSFLEFASGCVFVAHNARFDFTFLNAYLARLNYEPLPPPPVCTARLARRVVWPDVHNVRLATLAQYFRTGVRPTHRALPDAKACAEVLLGLLDMGERLGIQTLGDLHEAVRARGRPHFGKIRLADHLPPSPGVYLFKGRDGRVLYVGKSKDVRGRVKSYFYGDPRKQVEQLLAETVAVEGIRCDSELQALAVEARLIGTHLPKHNRRGKTWRRYAYLKVDAADAFPRIMVVREPMGDGAFLGPFGTTEQARMAKEALEDAFPIRRCIKRMRASTRFGACALAEMGRCLAPCEGRATLERYGELVRSLLSSLSSPGGLLGALERRMDDLVAQERFEEAALARDRLRALAEALARARADAWLLSPGHLELTDRDGKALRLAGGALVDADGPRPIPRPCPRDRADELAAIRSWLAHNRPRVERADASPSDPVEGGATLHRVLARFREARASRAPRLD
jgi:DNA polymerase III subunit epsilon